MEVQRVAIIGAGNGGCAAAADLTLRGFEVSIYSPFPHALESIQRCGGLVLEGVAGEGFVQIEQVTQDISQAVSDAQIVMVVVPTSALGFYAEKLAPVLREDQILFLNPGHTCGGLFFLNSLRLAGYRGKIRCGESSTLTYSARLQGPGRVMIYRVVPKLPFAALPGRQLDEIASAVSQIYPCISPRQSVLETAFSNMNAVEHPAQTVCNAGWIEHTKGDYYFYYEGTTPSVARVMEKVDQERMAVARALGIPVLSFAQDMYETGYTSKEAYESGSIYQVMQESEPNRWVKGPKSLDHRYLNEDVGYGLVPMAAFGDMMGVETPVMDSLIILASVLNDRAYGTEGLTLEKMGLTPHMTRQELESFLWEGYA